MSTSPIVILKLPRNTSAENLRKLYIALSSIYATSDSKGLKSVAEETKTFVLEAPPVYYHHERLLMPKPSNYIPSKENQPWKRKNRK